MGGELSFKRAGIRKDEEQRAVTRRLKETYQYAAERLSNELNPYYSLERPLTEGEIVNVRRLAGLTRSVNKIVDELADETEEIIKDSMLKVNKELVEEQKDWLRSVGFKDEALDFAFYDVPEKMVERMVAGEIYEGGWNLSDAIWGDSNRTKQDLYSIIAQGRIENRSLYEIAKDLESYVNPNKRIMWNLRMTDGRRIFKNKVEYNSQRLARTLLQHSYQQEVIETTRDNPFIKKWVWVANGSRACEVCKKRDGTVYTDPEDIPMDHPNGMCVIDVVESNTFADDLRDWYHAEDGEYPEIDAFAEKFGYKVALKDEGDGSFVSSILDDIFMDLDTDGLVGIDKDDILDTRKILHDEEFIAELEQALELYVGGGYESPKDALTDAQFEYILNQLEEFDGIAYRLESMQYTLGKQGLSIGDTFSFDDNLRSFTTDRDYVEKIVNDILWGEIPMANPVMFKTEGKVNMFNMRDYAKGYFEDQSEAFLGGMWEILNIETQLIGDLYVDVVTIKQRKSPLALFSSAAPSKTSLPETLKNIYSFVNDSWAKRVEQIRPKKEHVDVITSTIQDVVDKHDFAMRVPDFNTLRKIEASHFKNQFETGSSMGAYDRNYRLTATEELFGLPSNIVNAMDDIDFEKYGYLADTDALKDYSTNHRASQYGPIQVRFKKDRIRERTTLTLQDSLNFALDGSGKAVPVDNITPESIDFMDVQKLLSNGGNESAIEDFRDSSKDLETFIKNNHIPYVELQFHGHLTIDDVESITFAKGSSHDNLSNALRDRLEARGIKVIELD